MHPAERFVGMAYDAEAFDCADFVIHVQREMFGREVILNGRRPRGARGVAELGALSRQYAEPTDSPADGDLMLFRSGGGWHVGVLFQIAGEPHALHCPADGGFSLLQPLRCIPMTFEGYFRWI